MSTSQDTTPQFSQLLGHLMRGGAFGYWWRDDKKSSWWPVAKPTNPAPTKRNLYFGVNRRPVGVLILSWSFRSLPVVHAPLNSAAHQSRPTVGQ